jgi:acetyl-CoA C-acetyltransferase
MYEVAIVGVGEAQNGKFPERSPIGTAVDVAIEAIQDAGLEPKDIGAVLTAPAFGDANLNVDLTFGRLTQELGLRGKARFSFQVNQGGTTGADMLRVASGLIGSGEVSNVLCLHSDNFSNLSGPDIFKFFATAGFNREFETPLGMTYNAIAGLAAHRYMHETGTTDEQIAAVAVAHRRWASLNPNAAYRKPLSVEDVLASAVTQSPMHAFEIPMSVDGSSAFVVTSADNASRMVERPCYVHADASRVNTWSFTQHDDITRMNWRAVGEEAYAQAGITPSDVDIAEIYMAYSIFDLMNFEELGFAERGQAGAFILAGETSPGGSLPMTTNGGATSSGHTGSGVGVALMVESARQVMGKAGERQQKNVEFVLESAAGGSYMDANVTIYGSEKPSRKGRK